MAEKILNTRIQLKYDSYANWHSSSIILKAGEVAIAYLSANGTPATDDTNIEPQQPILFKVGDGVHTFAQLPWMSGLAADVYAWAKKPEAEFKTWAVNNITVLDGTDSYSIQELFDLHTQRLGNVSTLTTDKKTAVEAINEHDKEIGDTEDLQTTNKVLVAAINEVRQAVEVGGTGSVVTVRDDSGADSIKFTVRQGNSDVAVPIEFGVSSDFEFITQSAAVGSNEIPAISLSQSVKDALDLARTSVQSVSASNNGVVVDPTTGAVKVGHKAKPTTGAAETATAGSGRTYVTEVLTDEFGHIAGVKTATEKDQTFDFATIVPENETPVTIQNKTSTDTTDVIYAVSDLVEGGTNGHAITPTYTAVPTKDYVDKRVSGAVDYLGTVSDQETVDAKFTSETQIGDFARASATFTYTYGGDTPIEIHAGDLLIRDSGNEPFLFVLIHGEEGDITEVAAGTGLTGGGSVGKVEVALSPSTITSLGRADSAVQSVTAKNDGVVVDPTTKDVQVGHKAKPTTGTAQAATAGTGRTYVTEVTVDAYGHIAGVKTATETDQDLSGYKVRQTAVSSPAANGNALAFIDTISQNANGEITVTKKNVNLGEYAKTDDIAEYALEGESNGLVQLLKDGDMSGAVKLSGDGKSTLLSYTADNGYNEYVFSVADKGIATAKVADKAITTAKVADGAIGAAQTKASTDYTGDDAEVWVFNCGSATVNV